MLKWPLLSRKKKNNQKTDIANDVFSKEKYAIDCAEDFSNASPIFQQIGDISLVTD